MQEKVKNHGKLLKQELQEREAVETCINSVKSWVQETKDYLGNPTLEVDTQVEELKVPDSLPALCHNIAFALATLVRISLRIRIFRCVLYTHGVCKVYAKYNVYYSSMRSSV